MKKVIVVLTLVLFCLGTSLGYAEELKIGFINLKEVLDKYEKVTDGEDVLLKEAEQKNSQREKLVNDIKSMREKLELLKDNKKVQKQQELDGKIKELQDFTYQTRTSLRQKRDEKFREIMKEVKTVIEEYGQSRKYDVIIDDTLLLYKVDNLDATADITKTLNQRYKK